MIAALLGIAACEPLPAGLTQSPPTSAPLVPATLPASPSAATVTGRTVTEVTYSSDGTTPLGTFRNTFGRNWVETNSAGQATFSFLESARDDWSVYLVDNSRNMEIQLDLHTRLVSWNPFGQPRQPLYRILSARSAPAAAASLPASPPVTAVPASPPVAPVAAVTGRTVTEVTFPGGAFRSTGGGQWIETDAAGRVAFSFAESARDDWSVYLVDTSRNMEVQLDLHTRRVNWNLFGQPRQPLYEIVSAR